AIRRKLWMDQVLWVWLANDTDRFACSVKPGQLAPISISARTISNFPTSRDRKTSHARGVVITHRLGQYDWISCQFLTVDIQMARHKRPLANIDDPTRIQISRGGIGRN